MTMVDDVRHQPGPTRYLINFDQQNNRSGGISLAAGSIVLLAVFFYVFLGAAPVTGVGHLHASFGLDRLVSLDALFTLGHMAIYGVLTLSLCAIFRSASTRPAIAATLMGIGVGIEVMQEELFGRHFQLGDVFANTTGIAAALILLTMIKWRARRLRRSR